MIIVFKNEAKPEAKLALKQELELQGFTIHASDGVNASLFGVVGDTSNIDINNLYMHDCVQRVMRVSEPFRGGFLPNKGIIEWERLTVAIVGLGLMGGSFAKALKRLGTDQIIAIDKSADALVEAQRQGVIDIPLEKPDATLRQADIVILCIYPDAMVDYMQTMLPYLKPSAIITDIAGIKNDMIDKIQAMLPDTMEYISGHPMAGRQASGFAMSDASIFRNANYIIVPSEKNTPQGISWLETMARNLGCRYTVRVTPDEHDRTIAFTSNLPHITAVALMDSESYSEKTKYFIAGSFRDGTRVADINPDLWSKLFMANKEKVADEVDRYIEQLTMWRDALRTGDAEKMKELMRLSGSRRKELY